MDKFASNSQEKSNCGLQELLRETQEEVKVKEEQLQVQLIIWMGIMIKMVKFMMVKIILIMFYNMIMIWMRI